MKPGDRLVIYETGEHKSAVGTASVVSVEPRTQESPGEDQGGDGAGQAGNSGRSQGPKLFADSPLVRQGRLSVVPLSAAQFKFLTGE